MEIGTSAESAQLKKRDALEAEAHDGILFRITRAFVPQTAVRLQQLRILFCETIQTRTAESVFALDQKAKRDWKLPKRLLISLDRGQTRNQIAFTVRRATRKQLTVLDRRGKWSGSPFCEVAHRLHIVVSINNECFWTTATLTIKDWISRTDAKRSRPHPHTLHRLFNRLRDRAHACATRGHGRHAAEILQAFRKAACVPIYVAVKLGKYHLLCFLYLVL
jgi:hypothetical protein